MKTTKNPQQAVTTPVQILSDAAKKVMTERSANNGGGGGHCQGGGSW